MAIKQVFRQLLTFLNTEDRPNAGFFRYNRPMPTATLTFNLPEEETKFKARKGPDGEEDPLMYFAGHNGPQEGPRDENK